MRSRGAPLPGRTPLAHTRAMRIARHAPATARNRESILAVLRRVLPPSGTVLEIASGTGEHAVFLARSLVGIVWQPSDVDREARESIEAWRQQEGVANVCRPLAIDVSTDNWGLARADAIVCINMAHIAPWNATQGLFRGAARLLPPGAVLYLYGPYRIDGRPTAPSNQAFDASLRARDPAWGLRTTSAMRQLGEQHGFDFTEMVDMPANNFSLVFRRRSVPLPSRDESGILGT